MLTPLLLGALLPAVITLVILLIGRPQLSESPTGGWIAVIGVLLGVASSLVALVGFPEIPARTVDEWLFIWLLGGAFVGMMGGRSLAAHLGLTLLLSIGVAVALVTPLVPHALSEGQAVGLIAGVSVVLATMILGVTALVRRGDDVGASAGLATWTGGAAATIFFGATVVGAQQVGAVAAAVGAVAAFNLISKRAAPVVALVPMVVVAVGSAAVMAWLYADLTLVPVLLIASAPLGLLLPKVISPGAGKLLRAAIPATAVLLIIGGAAGLAASRYFADADTPAAYGAPDGASDGLPAEDPDPDAANDYGYE